MLMSLMLLIDEYEDENDIWNNDDEKQRVQSDEGWGF